MENALTQPSSLELPVEIQNFLAHFIDGRTNLSLYSRDFSDEKRNEIAKFLSGLAELVSQNNGITEDAYRRMFDDYTVFETANLSEEQFTLIEKRLDNLLSQLRNCSETGKRMARRILTNMTTMSSIRGGVMRTRATR